MTGPQIFRKKPVEIQAMQLNATTLEAISAWIESGGGRARPGEHVTQEHGRNRYPFEGDLSLFIVTLEGQMRADPGDWVIRGVKGEFYPCKPDIFEATYEAVSP